MSAADVDGDGDTDVLGAAHWADDVVWWENTAGDGTAWTEHTVDDDLDGPYSIFTADVDGDGDTDVLGAVDAEGIYWWENVAGDGTTTATVLTQAMVARGMRAVTSGHNPMALKRGMDRAAAAVTEEIAKRAKKIRTQEDVANVATLAANNDETIGKLIAEALEKVGRDGVVTVEEGKGLETTLEVRAG